MPMARPGTENACMARPASRSISAFEGAPAERALAYGVARAPSKPLPSTATPIRSFVLVMSSLSSRKGFQQALDDGPDAAQQWVTARQAAPCGVLLQHSRPVFGPHPGQIQRDADTSNPGVGQAADLHRSRDDLGGSGQREIRPARDRLPQWIVTDDERIGLGADEESHGDLQVAGMKQATLPLDHVPMARRRRR